MNDLAVETVSLGGTETSVTWRRSKRARRITLRIDARRGAVVVTLPMRAARSAGRALLVQHAGWVAERLASLPERVALAAGAEILLDGARMPVRHVPGGKGGAWLEAGALCISGDQAFLARRAGDFLREEARRRLAAQARAKAGEAGLGFARIVVKDTRSRWGSCSAKGVLMFCWRLVMAPPEVQDYVVAHEVAHLRHLNHGADFWRLTDALSPHRAFAVRWLHEEGPRLLRIG